MTVGAGTKSKINFGLKKCVFAMTNLQNYKRVKIRMDDLITQQFFKLQNLCYVYQYRYLLVGNFFTDTIVDICNCGSSAIICRYPS